MTFTCSVENSFGLAGWLRKQETVARICSGDEEILRHLGVAVDSFTIDHKRYCYYLFKRGRTDEESNALERLQTAFRKTKDRIHIKITNHLSDAFDYDIAVLRLEQKFENKRNHGKHYEMLKKMKGFDWQYVPKKRLDQLKVFPPHITEHGSYDTQEIFSLKENDNFKDLMFLSDRSLMQQVGSEKEKNQEYPAVELNAAGYASKLGELIVYSDVVRYDKVTVETECLRDGNEYTKKRGFDNYHAFKAPIPFQKVSGMYNNLF